MDHRTAAEDDRDRALVRRWLARDEGAAAELVDRYERALFNVALRMLGNVQDAEDVTQTVFCNAFAAIERYDPQYRFFSWIYRMAINESLNARARRRPLLTLSHGMKLEVPGVRPDQVMDDAERVGKALMDLRPDDRAVVVLRHFASFSYEEIAQTLDIPVRTVKSRLFTARQRLSTALLEQESRWTPGTNRQIHAD